MFGDDIKQALTHARFEARRLRHESVGAAHQALGVLRQPSPAVTAALAGIDTIEIAVKEARALGHDAVDYDHLLLGVLQVAGTVPHAVFEKHGVTANAAREIIRAKPTSAA